METASFGCDARWRSGAEPSERHSQRYSGQREIAPYRIQKSPPNIF